MSKPVFGERINIHAPIFEICELLDLDPETVAEIVFTPPETKVTVYERNDTGAFHLNPEKTAAMTRELTFATSTVPVNRVSDYQDDAA